MLYSARSPASGVCPFIIAATVLPPLLYVAPLAAAVALPLIALVGCVPAVMRPRWGDVWRQFSIFGPLLILMFASAAWALAPLAALGLGARLAILFFAATLLLNEIEGAPAEVRSALIRAVGWSASLTAAAVSVDLFFNEPLGALLHGVGHARATIYSRGAVFQSLLTVPLTLGLLRGGARRLAVAVFLLGAVAILAGSQLSAKLALLVSAVTAAAVLAAPRLRWMLPAALGIGAAAILAIVPIRLGNSAACWLFVHKTSAWHRVAIWNFVTARIREKPLFGWGLDAARRIPGGAAPVPLPACGDAHLPPEIVAQSLPLHPHNGFLQVWLELGLCGVVLGFGAVILILARGFAARGDSTRNAVLAAVAAPAISVGTFSFGIWQEWWIASIALAAAVAAAAAVPPGRSDGEVVSPSNSRQNRPIVAQGDE